MSVNVNNGNKKKNPFSQNLPHYEMKIYKATTDQ